MTRPNKPRLTHSLPVSTNRYHPNKQSLLHAVLADHLDTVASAVEAACDLARHKPLSEIVRTVVERFVDAKMERTDVSLALYQFAQTSEDQHWRSAWASDSERPWRQCSRRRQT